MAVLHGALALAFASAAFAQAQLPPPLASALPVSVLPGSALPASALPASAPQTSLLPASPLPSPPLPHSLNQPAGPLIRPKPFPNPGKRGIAFNDPSLTSPFTPAGQMSKIAWSYNWASDPYFPTNSYPPNSYNLGLSFVPMLWSLDGSMTGVWDANVAAAMAGFATDSLLAFNEPDMCEPGAGGSCMDVPTAVDGYRLWMQPYAGTARLGSPAVTNGVGANMGTSWLQNFLTACPDCQVDFIAVHWYGDVNDPKGFKDHIRSCWEQFRRPIWVTEFGVNNGSEEQIAVFLRRVMRWMDRQGYVERYAYFMARNTGSPYLLNGDDSMTAVGSAYLSG